MKIKRFVITPDLQVPFHSERGTNLLARFIERFKPHYSICIGDEIDLPQLGSFNAGSIGELEGNIHEDREWVQYLAEKLQWTDVVGSNHGIRLYKSIRNRLPAFLNLPELRYEQFMGYNDLGIKFHPDGMKLGNYLIHHGDAFPISNKPSQTALNAVMRVQKNVLIGHTHRLGMSAYTASWKGNLTHSLYGIEVGHLTDIKSHGFAYTKGYQNWQAGFVYGYIDGIKVHPIVVPMEKDFSFVAEGRIYA